MPTASNTTIGINLGSRYVGTAVIIGTELREWRLRVIRGKTYIEKFQRLTSILSRLVDSYSPTSVTLKKFHSSRSSPMLDRLQLEAKAYLQENGITVHEYTLDQIKAWLLPGKRVSKAKLAEFIVAQYPILFEEWGREKLLRRPYHMVVFESVALANASIDQIDNREDTVHP
ncbi:MAG: hypothetical protein HZB59_06905 [Ignavibacteriales bacterium]|nr:hypothetical protein [Ignavibacteriales bacterium]